MVDDELVSAEFIRRKLSLSKDGAYEIRHQLRTKAHSIIEDGYNICSKG